MKTINTQLQFFITLAQVQSKLTNTFDRHLLGGLGFNDFIVLYHLSCSPEQKMRRVDLAEKIGVTPSGVTRMLLPMEKLGWVTREASETDARVSFVKLAPGGKRLLLETLEEAELTAKELLPSTKLVQSKDIGDIFRLFTLNQVG